MPISGTGLKDPNTRLRFLIYVFMGVAAFGSVLYWRSHLMVQAEYVEIGAPVKKQRQNDNIQRSSKYQLESFEVNPSIN